MANIIIAISFLVVRNPLSRSTFLHSIHSFKFHIKTITIFMYVCVAEDNALRRWCICNGNMGACCSLVAC